MRGPSRFGGIRVPPLPQFVVFLDRDDGTEWALSHADDDEDQTRVTTNTDLTAVKINRGSLPPRKDVLRIDNLGLGEGIRLFVRGGRLGYELTPFETSGVPAQTRIGVVRESYALYRPSSWYEDGDNLAWSDVSEI